MDKLIDDKRSIGFYILLSCITCGIYHYIFLYGIIRDINIICDGDGEDTPGLGEFILFSLLTCNIYAFYWYYKLGNRQADNAERYNVRISENGTTVLVWMLLGGLIFFIGWFVAIGILIKNTNLLACAYNHIGNTPYRNEYSKDRQYYGNADYSGKPNYSINPSYSGNPNYSATAKMYMYGMEENSISLVCRSGEFAGCKFPIHMNESVSIGRDLSSNIKFNANTPRISRTHCTVIYDGTIWLIDNGSSCGTYLDNGTKLSPNARVALQKGSGFWLGSRDVSFYIE